MRGLSVQPNAIKVSGTKLALNTVVGFKAVCGFDNTLIMLRD